MLKKFDCYDGVSFFEGLCFFAPVALLVRTQAGISESQFFMLQALISVTIFLGEVPTGMLADLWGYKRTLVVSHLGTLSARILLTLAFFLHSPALFAVEAVVEGLANCFYSGTADAYVYEVYGCENYLHKSAQSANYCTAGFICSTLGFLVLYKFFGIPGLLIATVLTYLVSVGFSFGLPREQCHAQARPVRPSPARLLQILGQKQAATLMALSAVFTISAILVNFFYAEKLALTGLDLKWLSPIILAYSLTEMLAKPILDRLKHAPRHTVLGSSCAVAAGAMLIFSRVTGAGPVVGLMLILPLLLSIPAFFLGEQKNAFVDDFSSGENRAATLSVLNMGGGLAEILALFASAALTGLGVGTCFLAVGMALLGFGVYYIINGRV